MKGLFVTGTDTGVGKTVFSATLCRALRARGVNAIALKPFASGIHEKTHWKDNDPLILAAAADYAEAPETIAPVRLAPALSPYDAARISHTSFDIPTILQVVQAVASKYDFVIVEGVGGVAVPLAENYMVSDLIEGLGLQAFLVARSRLGTINHSLLSLNWLRSKGIGTLGLAFTRSQEGPTLLEEDAGIETVCRLARVACFGMVAYSPQFDQAATLDVAIRNLPVNDPTMQSIVEHIAGNNL